MSNGLLNLRDKTCKHNKKKECIMFNCAIAKMNQTHLYLIHRSSIWITITMNDNTVVTFVYEVCTSTDIIEIRGTTNPMVQLSNEEQKLDKMCDIICSKLGFKEPTCLGWATNQTWQAWCVANRLTLVSIWLTYSVSVLQKKISHWMKARTFTIQ